MEESEEKEDPDSTLEWDMQEKVKAFLSRNPCLLDPMSDLEERRKEKIRSWMKSRRRSLRYPSGPLVPFVTF